MPRPQITLPTPYLAQTRYERDKVTVLQVDANDANSICRAFVRLGGNESFKYWATVSAGASYNPEPTQAEVAAAVIAFFAALAPAP